MNKEILRNIHNKIVSSGIAAGIGLASSVGGAADLGISWEITSNTVENRNPSMSSPTEIKQARNEILVFDKEVRDLIVARKPPEDIAGISTGVNISGIAKSIELVRQEEAILQQRQELLEQLQHKRLRRSSIDGIFVLGGILLFSICDFIDRRKFQMNLQKIKY